MFALGRTLFAGPLLGVIVTASGAIACAATPGADALRHAWIKPAIAAQAACTAEARVERIVTAEAPLVAGGATVAGTALAEFSGAGALAGAATVAGAAKVEFFLAGDSAGEASPQAKIIRSVKFRGRVSTTATLDADPQLWAVAEGRVVGYANPFGTTNYVGRGESLAVSAAATQELQRQTPAAGAAEGVAAPVAVAQTDFFSAGDAAAAATLHAEPAVLQAGVLTYDAFGAAVGEAALSNGEPIRYSVSLAVGQALLDAAPSRERPGKGQADCNAQAKGEAELVVPMLGEAVLTSEATGLAWAFREAGAEAHVLSAAVGEAAAKVEFAAAGAASALATPANTQVVRGLTGQRAAATAEAAATGYRDVAARGASAVEALPAAAPVVEGRAKGAAVGTAKPVGQAELVVKILVSGEALGTAELRGANRVNDYAQAPARRTHVVPPFSRLVVVTSAPRLIATAGTNRRAAA